MLTPIETFISGGLILPSNSITKSAWPKTIPASVVCVRSPQTDTSIDVSYLENKQRPKERSPKTYCSKDTAIVMSVDRVDGGSVVVSHAHHWQRRQQPCLGGADRIVGGRATCCTNKTRATRYILTWAGWEVASLSSVLHAYSVIKDLSGFKTN